MADAWVYMLRCGDGSLYTGWSTDVSSRLARHRAGKASRYTASRLPVKLELMLPMPGRSAAMREEARIKARFRAMHDPLKVLIVTAKLLTGFDAPIEGVMYLDKPLREHNLFQALALLSPHRWRERILQHHSAASAVLVAFHQRNFPRHPLVIFHDLVPRDPEKIRRQRVAPVCVEFPRLANQRHENILHNLFRGPRAAGHAQRKAV